MRCEDGDDLAEILTEGDLDRDVFVDAVNRWGGRSVNVIDADYLAVEVEDLEAAGLSPGVRSQLLAVAHRLEERTTTGGTIRAKVAVIVDRDYEVIEVTSRFLFVTDGYSIESYLICEDAFDRFMTTGLGRGVRASVRGGETVATRMCSGEALLARVLKPAIELAAVHLALRELSPPVATFTRWSRYLTTDKHGNMDLRGGTLIANVLQTAGKSDETARAEARRIEAAAQVAASPAVLVRGRDFVAILLHLLRSNWGRSLAGNVQGWDENRVGRMLFLALPTNHLDGSPLFMDVRAHLGLAA